MKWIVPLANFKKIVKIDIFPEIMNKPKTYRLWVSHCALQEVQVELQDLLKIQILNDSNSLATCVVNLRRTFLQKRLDHSDYATLHDSLFNVLFGQFCQVLACVVRIWAKNLDHREQLSKKTVDDAVKTCGSGAELLLFFGQVVAYIHSFRAVTNRNQNQQKANDLN